MPQKLPYLRETPSQTAGPYLHIGLSPRAAGFEMYTHDPGTDIAGPHAAGERIRIEGTITDGTGTTVRDALIEIWQANAAGRYPDPENPDAVERGFAGWGRASTDFITGRWGFDTIKPGVVADQSGRPMAPHINLWIVARGINIGLNTRLYFSDEEAANATDPILQLIEAEARRTTLIAKRDATEPRYSFDVRLQGDDETVFFDI